MKAELSAFNRRSPAASPVWGASSSKGQSRYWTVISFAKAYLLSSLYHSETNRRSEFHLANYRCSVPSAACRSRASYFRLKVFSQLWKRAFKEFHPVLACAGSGPARLEIKIDLDYIKAIRGRVCEMNLDATRLARYRFTALAQGFSLTLRSPVKIPLIQKQTP